MDIGLIIFLVLPFVVSLPAFVVYNWLQGCDLTFNEFLSMILVALVPVLNVFCLILVAHDYHFIFKGKRDIVILRGRKIN